MENNKVIIEAVIFNEGTLIKKPVMVVEEDIADKLINVLTPFFKDSHTVHSFVKGQTIPYFDSISMCMATYMMGDLDIK